MDAAFSPDGRKVLSRGSEKTARLCSVPVVFQGEAEHILLWAQVATAAELDDSDQVRVVNASSRNRRRQRLHELGVALLSP